jgi:hypothetical protein
MSVARNNAARSLGDLTLIGESVKFTDKGTVSSGTVTITRSVDGDHIRLQVGGAITFAFAGQPAAGQSGSILLELVNGGAFAVTMPTINWIKPDGSFTTSISAYFTAIGRAALQTTGTDFLYFFTRDGGSTVYGKLL